MDPEKKDMDAEKTSSKYDVEIGIVQDEKPTGIWSKLAALGGVEVRGFVPVPIEERTTNQSLNIFFLWFCMNLNLLPVVTGMVGTLSYGLSLRDASLVILFFTLLSAFAPAFFTVFGPKTGMRQMIHARFTFGRYLIFIPIILNLATLTGFAVVDSVIGGQTLAAVSNGNLSVNVGIVIICILALCISFCGYKVLHTYERYAWIPAFFALLVTVGVGGKHLSKQVVPAEPATAGTILSFGCLVAGFMLPWAALASDFSTYCYHQVPSWKLFSYAYSGLIISTILLMVLGAAIGGATPNVESWMNGYDELSVGGVVAAMVSSVGGFGRFIVVLHAFAMLGNTAATMYSITLNLQMSIPRLLARVPRAIFAILITAIIIPVAIEAAVSFFDSLENFIGIVGYWTAAFIAVIVVEHFVFRGGDYSTYSEEAWDNSAMLPSGVAALAASVLSFGLVIPSMAQVWYTGPIAETTGDIGFELAFVVSGVLYLPLRFAEKKMRGC